MRGRGVTAETKVITVELDSGENVDLDLESYPEVELGYAGNDSLRAGANGVALFGAL